MVFASHLVEMLGREEKLGTGHDHEDQSENLKSTGASTELALPFLHVSLASSNAFSDLISETIFNVSSWLGRLIIIVEISIVIELIDVSAVIGGHSIAGVALSVVVSLRL